jgi:hypothetical protein
MRKIARIGAQALSHRVHPDIPGHGFHLGVLPQNIVIIFRLPQSLARFLLVLKGGELFEPPQEYVQGAVGPETLREQVQVVWHEAEGMNGEPAGNRGFVQAREAARNQLRVREERPSLLTTDCDEIEALPNVAPGGKTDVFA